MSSIKFTPAAKGAFRIYLNNIRKSKPLSEEQINELLSQYHYYNDINARNKVVENCQLYVLSVAKTFLTPNFEIEDLIQEGNIGLITATEYYNPALGIPFIVYATWWIKKYISLFLKQYRTIFTMPRKCMDEIIVEDIYKPLTDDDSCTLEGTLYNDEDISLEEEEQKEARLAMIRKTLKSLSLVEQFVIMATYGIDCTPLRDKDIADKLGYNSVEYIRKIRNNALRTLQINL